MKLARGHFGHERIDSRLAREGHAMNGETLSGPAVARISHALALRFVDRWNSCNSHRPARTWNFLQPGTICSESFSNEGRLTLRKRRAPGWTPAFRGLEVSDFSN